MLTQYNYMVASYRCESTLVSYSTLDFWLSTSSVPLLPKTTNTSHIVTYTIVTNN